MDSFVQNESIGSVVKNNVCIGCGACAFATGGKMRLTSDGLFEPDDVSQTAPVVYCPMLTPELDEDRLADHFLGDSKYRSDKLGKFDEVWAAHVEEGTWRRDGSSGGVGSWLATELLERGLVDAVIHVRPTKRLVSTDPFFRYSISRTREQIRASAHSHYHVVELSEVLKEVSSSPGRYLFIGVPCMVKTVRRVQVKNPVVASRILYTMALVCGHLKSVNWSLSLGWGAGISPCELSAINFRVKSASVPSRAYYFEVVNGRDGSRLIVDSANIVGGKFNLGAMMPEACNYCDDVVGETADITIGDAWLPRYACDWRGKNMLVLRNPELSSLIAVAATEGRVALEPMSHAEAVDAQAGGFRQRREGLIYRLALARLSGSWVPVKRTFQDISPPGPLRRSIYRLRMKVSRLSIKTFREALALNDYTHYSRHMQGTLRRLRQIELAASALRVVRLRVKGKVGMYWH